MIIKCTENKMPEDMPDRTFSVEIGGNESPADVLRLCGKIPKPHEDRGGKWKGWTVNNISLVPFREPPGYSVLVEYAPPAVIEASDEPQFPPYAGPVGKQPDGSFILSPKAFHYLREAWMYRAWDFGSIGPKLPRQTHFDKFCGVLSDETGYGDEEYT
jgi:hypothetical protein